MPTTTPTVQALTRPPFGDFSGQIAPSTGGDEFVELPSSEKLLAEIAKRSVKRASCWMLGGEYGSGKTWALSWLLRSGPGRLEARTGVVWAVIGFPLRVSVQPDRGFYESFFVGAESERARVLTFLQGQTVVSPANPITNAVRSAIAQTSYWEVLEGRARTFPKRKGRSALPPWAVPSNRDAMFVAFLRLLRSAGAQRLLILVDEFEASVLTGGPSGLKKLSHFLRNLIDTVASTEGLPHTEIVLAATADVVNRINPEKEGTPTERTGEVAGLVAALQERLDQNYLLPDFSMDDALKIAAFRIRKARKYASPSRPYVPFDLEAIKIAYENCSKTVRRFCLLLEGMYEEALETGAKAITATLANQVVAQRLGSPESHRRRR